MFHITIATISPKDIKRRKMKEIQYPKFSILLGNLRQKARNAMW
jgi:hypothetical protein